MQDTPNTLAEILRFQQSLLHLVTQGSGTHSQHPESISSQTRQLEDWARQLQPQGR